MVSRPKQPVTDWVIHYLNGYAQIVARIQDLSPQGIALSVISLAELYEVDLDLRDPQKSDEALQDFSPWYRVSWDR